jgi:hypothetical protein
MAAGTPAESTLDVSDFGEVTSDTGTGGDSFGQKRHIFRIDCSDVQSELLFKYAFNENSEIVTSDTLGLLFEPVGDVFD